MQTRIASGCGIRWTFASLIAVTLVAASGATPAVAEVFDGNVILRTQTQVDNFADSGITEVTGNLIVSEDGTDPITNLDGLSGLTSVGGNLSISSNHPSLTDVDGLCGLMSVGGILNISDNSALTNVDGLSGLTSVGRILYIHNNSALTNVDGLSGLTSVGEYLRITYNSALTNVDGLSGLMSAGGNLFIESNGSLTDFCGLYPLLAVRGLAGGYYVSGNEYNPTEQDILDGGPCDPAEMIQQLYADGAITDTEATALMNLADHSLDGLTNALYAFVQHGIVKPSQAQLLYVIASNWQAAM